MGSAKTTLFRMVVGEESPDDGTVSVPKKVTIGCFSPGRRGNAEPFGLDEAIAATNRPPALHVQASARTPRTVR